MKFLSKLLIERHLLLLTLCMWDHIRVWGYYLSWLCQIHHGLPWEDSISRWPHCNWLLEKINKKKLYTELGWESLTERRNLHRLFTYHKIIFEKTPPHSNEFVLSEPLNANSPNRYQNTFSLTATLSGSSLTPASKLLTFISYSQFFSPLSGHANLLPLMLMIGTV